MSEQIEYIEPTQEHVGQMVEVRDGEDSTWRTATFVGIVSDFYKFVAKPIGHVSGLCWSQARIARPLTYAERQAKCGLKVGDRVKIVSLPETEQDGWEDSVLPCMRRLVGSVDRIERDCGADGFSVSNYNWPYFVLEKVEDRVATRRDIDAAVYVDGNPQDVFTLEHWYSCDNQPCRAVVSSGDKRFVYELSNLRVKE